MGRTPRPRRLRAGLGALVVALGLCAIAAAAPPRISVRGGHAGAAAIAFRVTGFRECDSVVSDANVIAWVGPQIDIFVRRGTSIVMHDNWEACTLPSGQYLTWELSAQRDANEWSARGSRNVFTLKARMTRAGTYRYTYRITLNGNAYKAGKILVTATGTGTYRIALH